MPWIVIYPLAGAFSYDGGRASTRAGEWIIRT